MDPDIPAAARAAPDRNNPRRLIFLEGIWLEGIEAPPHW